MAPPKRSVNPSGLGRAIINKKTQEARKAYESGKFIPDVDPTSRLKSVTQEHDLDEFLYVAQLAGTEFIAEKRNVKIVQTDPRTKRNPYLLSEQEEQSARHMHQANKKRLRVPRRPPWNKGMTNFQLERQEKEAFLEWRRGLAELQERDGLLLTPFERNLEVWRQLWRVLERSHLVVQIVDARNPLMFRCEDLEAYVMDVEGPEGEKGTGRGKRRNLLLINKADLLTAKQRRLWADHFDQQGIKYSFFSAANAAALQQTRRDALATLGSDAGSSLERDQSRIAKSGEVREGEGRNRPEELASSLVESAEEFSDASEEGLVETTFREDSIDEQDPRTKILSVLELEALFERVAPDLTTFTGADGNAPSKLVVGLVGYPNVGKSSTINALLGEKKVSVSSTPGKTKHFQTIHLSPSIILCDCPGLVFPQFTTMQADLICDGVLPIDQMREYTGPTALLVKRIPKEVLEAVYGLFIKVDIVDEGGDGQVTAENFLIACAIARGYTKSGQGNPDEARAARYILKDYVNAKILYCHPPPGISAASFNEQTHMRALQRAEGKKRAPVTRVGKNADTYVPVSVAPGESGQRIDGKTQALDREFFSSNATLSARPFVRGTSHDGREFTRALSYPHQKSIGDDGRPLDVESVTNALRNGVELDKHHKKPKRMKQRSGKGYYD